MGTTNLKELPKADGTRSGFEPVLICPPGRVPGAGKGALIADDLGALRYAMTATASKVNASIARHSLSVPPGGTISPRSTILAIKGPKVAIPRSQIPSGVRSTVKRSVSIWRTIRWAMGGSSKYRVHPDYRRAIRRNRRGEGE